MLCSIRSVVHREQWTAQENMLQPSVACPSHLSSRAHWLCSGAEAADAPDDTVVDVDAASDSRRTSLTAGKNSSAVAASNASASPAMGTRYANALEAAADSDREASGGRDSVSSDAGYESAEDWSATPNTSGQAPVDGASPAPLRSADNQLVGPPSAEAKDDHQPDALDGALADTCCNSAHPV